MSNIEKKIHFVTRPLTSDVVGDLKLSVRFAQSSIMLSNNNLIQGDYQPHLIANRDTLLLVKDVNGDIPIDKNINLKIYDANNQLIHSDSCSTINDYNSILGSVPNHIICDDNTFIEPEAYDYEISTQAEFNKFSADKEGKYLSDLLKQYNSIKITTSDSNYIPNFYLPQSLTDNQIITFVCNSQYSINIYKLYVNELTLIKNLKNNQRMIFTNFITTKDTKWITTTNTPNQFDYIISTQEELSKMKDDIQGLYLGNLLKQYNSIKITTSNYNHIPNFYLPQTLLKDQTITFECNSSYSINVYPTYNSNINVANYSTNQTQTYTNSIIDSASPKWIIKNDLASETYDYTISTQSEFNEMATDTAEYLYKLLTIYNKIKIITSNGNYLSSFKLPKIFLANKIISFESNSSYNFTVEHENKTDNYKTGQKSTYKNDIISMTSSSWFTKEDYDLSQIGYLENPFTCLLNNNIIQPNIKLEFEYLGKKSYLTNINVGATTEVLIHTIDIGMLTPPQQIFFKHTNSELHRQYFETIPASRLIISQYAPIFLQEVMLPNGTLLEGCDPSFGGVYDGDMRETIGKDLISLGINNANYGLNFSSVGEYSYTTCQITAHTSIGSYCNEGIVGHGLSGGGGMVTLYSATGNEWSHELGHNYNLPHYPNGFNGSVHRPDGEINSTWGFHSTLFGFVPNFFKSISNEDACLDGTCVPPFEGHKFNFDAMAGGVEQYSNYTLHTPYALCKIQEFFENKAMFDRNSTTGFSKWNNEKKKMENFVNIINNVEKKPILQGVPVITLLGYFNTDISSATPGYIYPALSGSYGMVYEPDLVNTITNNEAESKSVKQELGLCYLEVAYTVNNITNINMYNLTHEILREGLFNKFHVNIEKKAEALSYDVSIVYYGIKILQKMLEVPTDEISYSVSGLPL